MSEPVEYIEVALYPNRRKALLKIDTITAIYHENGQEFCDLWAAGELYNVFEKYEQLLAALRDARGVVRFVRHV